MRSPNGAKAHRGGRTVDSELCQRLDVVVAVYRLSLAAQPNRVAFSTSAHEVRYTSAEIRSDWFHAIRCTLSPVAAVMSHARTGSVAPLPRYTLYWASLPASRIAASA